MLWMLFNPTAWRSKWIKGIYYAKHEMPSKNHVAFVVKNNIKFWSTFWAAMLNHKVNMIVAAHPWTVPLFSCILDILILFLSFLKYIEVRGKIILTKHNQIVW